MMAKKKDLVKIIKANPGAVAVIDNDCWWLNGVDGNELASSDDDLVERGEGYGSGSTYGGDLLQACAEIAGIKVESV